MNSTNIKVSRIFYDNNNGRLRKIKEASERTLNRSWKCRRLIKRERSEVVWLKSDIWERRKLVRWKKILKQESLEECLVQLLFYLNRFEPPVIHNGYVFSSGQLIFINLFSVIKLFKKMDASKRKLENVRILANAIMRFKLC